MAARFRLLGAVAAFVVLLDQITKIHIDRTFALYESLPVVPNFFAITYLRNKGAAFGILADSSVRVPFFIIVSLLAIAAIFWYFRQLQPGQTGQQVGLSLILGGAVGNLIDRIRLGEVIDFLDVHWYQYHWPAFNVADSAICVGVGLLLLCMWREERRLKVERREG
ncbi:MAG: signal peptidase II [Syntrophotaleaceae bacterium]